MLAGLVVLGLNFSNPKVAKETINALTDPLKVKKAPQAARPQAVTAPQYDEEADRALQTKRYVQIQGKLYEYNPRGVYNVNGVPTMYKNGQPKTWAEIQAERAQAEGIRQQQEELSVDPSTNGYRREANQAKIQDVQKMAEQGALSVYTPGGVQRVIEGAKAAAEAANERQHVLNELSR